MWLSVNSKTKSYWIYWRIALLFIFLYQPLILQPLQPQVFLIGIMIIEASVWLQAYHDRLFNMIKLVNIGFAINPTFIGLIDS